MLNEKRARVIAFYLPQFHPIPENNKWWGEGFTEWTNVAKARPLFKGHYQPKLPADLGFYDLRMPETRIRQAELARQAGIEGFCYWHYWFGKGRELLNRPFDEVLESGIPDFPFCLGWANHSWSSKTWERGSARQTDSLLMEQTYVESEYADHFNRLLPAFKDARYITVDRKPLFVVFDPLAIPDPKRFIDCWNGLAVENGLKGIHFVGIMSNLSGFRVNDRGAKEYYAVRTNEEAAPRYEQLLDRGFDAVNSRGLFRAELATRGALHKYKVELVKRIFKKDLLNVFEYRDIIKHLFVPEDKWENVYPTILPNWDRSARSGKKANIYHHSTPELFRRHLQEAIAIVKDKQPEHRILFLMSWNEWAEGNYVEPDLKYGRQYLEVIHSELIG